MSQRPVSRKSNNKKQPIQEPNKDNNELSRIAEEGSNEECPEQYSRYDPKELRDAARIFSPFLKLIDEVTNPYARLVARELCDTFHSLFYPNKHPNDVMKSFNPLLKSQKSIQMWNEFWLYTPESRYKKWVPLRKESLIEINDECDPCRPQDKTDCGPTEHQQCSDSENFIRQRSKSNNRNQKPTQNCDINEPRTPIRQSPECVSYNDMCGSDSYANLCDISPPDNMFDDSYPNLCDISPPADMCEPQFAAGSDSLPVIQSPKSMYSPFLSSRNQKYDSRSDSKYIQNKADDIEFHKEQHVEMSSFDTMSEETIDQNKTDYNTSQNTSINRQYAGDDVYLPYCKPGCSTDPDYVVSDYVENPAQYEYYRVTGNSPLSRGNANDQNVLRAMSRSPVEPELRTNALDDPIIDDECDDSDSVNSEVNINQITCKAKMVASAFTTISLAQQELHRKQNAFKALTKNYLNYASNPIEADPPCADTKSTKKILKAIYKNPPKILMPFDNSEWNDNCFRDKDFVRLLPFYEIVHNQLEYISKIQREYGVNMLDDIISVFYHIHYDLGDPRLKNDMLIEHVKLVTKNTWESYFYPGDKKMPAIPEKPELYYSPSPVQQSMSQHLSPIQLRSRQVSPKPPNQVPPALRQVSPKPPKQETPPPSSDQSGPCKNQKPRPSTATHMNRRPQTTSHNRAPDVPQQTENLPVTTKSK